MKAADFKQRIAIGFGRHHSAKSLRTSALPAAVFAVVLLFLSAFPLVAADPSSAFDAANRLYAQNKYSEAAAGYEQLIAAGSVSPALYFNLGNANFKSGQIGRALAAYRQAEAL